MPVEVYNVNVPAVAFFSPVSGNAVGGTHVSVALEHFPASSSAASMQVIVNSSLVADVHSVSKPALNGDITAIIIISITYQTYKH